MKPPYKITDKALSLCLEIATILGHLDGIQSHLPRPELRKKNRIKTIQGSLAIEGNTLSISQVTALIDSKPVVGSQKEIKEVVNAVKAYDHLSKYKHQKIESLLKCHNLLLHGLIEDSGSFRHGGVGILKGNEVSHVAPPASRVPKLMENLFSFLKSDKETHLIIKSCVFHYELMFIHPFLDGNGRVGRLWQTVILIRHHPVFQYLPIEQVIKDNQKAYYEVLEQCDSEGESTHFIEFLLGLLLNALQDLKNQVKSEIQTPDSRLGLAQNNFAKREFTRKDYMLFHKTVSTATASRDLKHGIDCGKLSKLGEKALTRYNFK